MSEKLNLLEVEFTDKIVADLLPEWKGSDIDVSVLSGGITNKLYRARCDKGDVAIRIYGDKTEMFINRDREAHALQQMADAGITSKLIKYMPEKNVTIVEFITGSYTMKNSDFLKDELRETIMDPVRRIHSSGAVLDYIFNPYEQCTKMYGILSKLNVDFPEYDIEGTLAKLKKLDEKINIPVKDYVITHNDLLADNFILVTEEYKDKFEKPIYIIDWEYGGMGPKYYDLADMFQEILVPREYELKIVESYCEGKDFDKVLYYIDMFKPFPDIYWFLWSLIQKTVSTIEFDFYTYGKIKYDNAQSNIRYLQTEYGVKI
ncbi:MAG: choline/ethanolamine kinase family protein [Spirochaetia bacterium]|jgi:thiamine kinase-like enzyme|nr:choline/ethanolamine kinase family protein [Spirochaetia bacterium]